VLAIDEEAFAAEAGAVNLGALAPVAGPQQMAEKAHMMQPERALALVGRRQERLRFLRRDQCQDTIHARPGRRARGGGERHRGLERGHHKGPFVLVRVCGPVSPGTPGADEGGPWPPRLGHAWRGVELLGLVSRGARRWRRPLGGGLRPTEGAGSQEGSRSRMPLRIA